MLWPAVSLVVPDPFRSDRRSVDETGDKEDAQRIVHKGQLLEMPWIGHPVFSPSFLSVDVSRVGSGAIAPDQEHLVETRHHGAKSFFTGEEVEDRLRHARPLRRHRVVDGDHPFFKRGVGSEAEIAEGLVRAMPTVYVDEPVVPSGLFRRQLGRGLGEDPYLDTPRQIQFQVSLEDMAVSRSGSGDVPALFPEEIADRQFLSIRIQHGSQKDRGLAVMHSDFQNIAYQAVRLLNLV